MGVGVRGLEIGCGASCSQLVNNNAARMKRIVIIQSDRVLRTSANAPVGENEIASLCHIRICYLLLPRIFGNTSLSIPG